MLGRGLVTRLRGGVSHARMGGGRRRPRCRGDRPVLPYPIDRRLRLCVDYAPCFIYWPTHRTIVFINRATSATLILIGLTGLFTEMVRQWDHHHAPYAFGVER